MGLKSICEKSGKKLIWGLHVYQKLMHNFGSWPKHMLGFYAVGEEAHTIYLVSNHFGQKDK